MQVACSISVKLRTIRVFVDPLAHDLNQFRDDSTGVSFMSLQLRFSAPDAMPVHRATVKWLKGSKQRSR
jgi:DNA primase